MDQETFNKSVHRMLDRLIVLTDVFRFSMQKEFWPSAKASEDWKDNLSWLVESVEPIRFLSTFNDYSEFIGNEKEKAITTKEEISAFCDNYENKIKEAIKNFEEIKGNNNSKTHITTLLECTGLVHGAYDSASSFKHSLGKNSLPDKSFQAGDVVNHFKKDQNQKLVKLNKVYENVINQAKQSIESCKDRNGEIEACMASRKLHLVSSYYRFMFPSEWTTEMSSDVTSYQRSIANNLSFNTAFRKSVLSRIDDHEYYFSRLAA